MINRQTLIKNLINENLKLCQNNTELNDSMIWDLLEHGFKGFNNMTDHELKLEWENLNG